MPEVLLSRPLLQSIGFNLDKHLSAVRTLYHDADFSHVGFTVDQDTQENLMHCDNGALSRLLQKPGQQDKESLPIDECEEYVNDANSASSAALFLEMVLQSMKHLTYYWLVKFKD